MKRIFSLISLVAAAAIIGSCAKEICEEPDAQEKAEEGFVVTVTSSVSFGPNTRALTDDGVKTFAVGEKIAVVYESWDQVSIPETKVAVSNALTADDISENGKSTKFTVSLDNPVQGNVTFVYPATMVDEEGNEISLKAQNGTFEGLQALDYSKGSGTLQVEGQEVALPLGVALVNQVAVAKITLKDIDGSADLTGITLATINNGTEGYRITPKSPATTLSWPIYVAMKPTANVDINVAATDGTYHYEKSATGKTFSAGNIYPITAQMNKGDNVVDLSFLTADYEAQDGDTLVNALTGDYKISIAADASITLRNATIGCLSHDAFFAGITCSGDATINLKGKNYVQAGGGSDDREYWFDSWGAYPGIYVKKNSTLTIQGNGELTVWTYKFVSEYSNTIMYGNSAAIGGGCYSSNNNCGTIIIKSGTINAYGGGGAAAIGAGACSLWNQVGGFTCDGIRIEGGNIHAIGGELASGIGAGYGTSCGNIVITGGVIIAEGGEQGAGIGSGYAQEFYSTCGDITISGAEVTAIGGRFAAGIGSGVRHSDASCKNSSCGNIWIYGGATVTARTNGNGGVLYAHEYYGAAGIGTGASSADAPNYCGIITIAGDVTRVTATKASDATNCLGRNYSTGVCEKVTINGTDYANGIGPNQTDGNTFIYPDN